MVVLLPNGQSFNDVVLAAPFDGAGANGTVVYNPAFMAADGTARVFIFTGDNPEPYGYFTIATKGRVPVGERPICLVSAAWTNADYAFGYAIPPWPMHSLQMHQYLLDASGSVSFRWDAVLQANASYSVNIYCGAK